MRNIPLLASKATTDKRVLPIWAFQMALIYSKTRPTSPNKSSLLSIKAKKKAFKLRVHIRFRYQFHIHLNNASFIFILYCNSPWWQVIIRDNMYTLCGLLDLSLSLIKLHVTAWFNTVFFKKSLLHYRIVYVHH